MLTFRDLHKFFLAFLKLVNCLGNFNYWSLYEAFKVSGIWDQFELISMIIMCLKCALVANQLLMQFAVKIDAFVSFLMVPLTSHFSQGIIILCGSVPFAFAETFQHSLIDLGFITTNRTLQRTPLPTWANDATLAKSVSTLKHNFLSEIVFIEGVLTTIAKVIFRLWG